MIWIWGGYPRSISVPDLFKGQFRFGNISFPKYNLAIILFAIIVGIVFWLVLKRTKIGMIIRAGVDNFEITSTIGINIKWLFSLVFCSCRRYGRTCRRSWRNFPNGLPRK